MLFAVGIGGVVHEAVFTQLDRPALLVVYAAMIGLPGFLRANGK